MSASSCAKCGAPLEAGQAFCKSCGAACSAEAPAASFAPVGYSGSREPKCRRGEASRPPKAGLMKRLFGSKGKANKADREKRGAGSSVSTSKELTCPQCGRPAKEWHRCCLGCGFNLESLHRQSEHPKSTPSIRTVRTNLEDQTISLELEESGGYDDDTTVLDEAPVVRLTRMATGERIEVLVPAVIGKGSEATCRIGGNTAISRCHARVECLGEEVYVEDLGSTNKTKVNGVVVEAGSRARVRNADVLSLANEEFTLSVEKRT